MIKCTVLSGANSLHWAALNSKRTSSFWQTPGETHVRPRKAKLHSLGTFHTFSSLFFPNWTSNKSHHIYFDLYIYINVTKSFSIINVFSTPPALSLWPFFPLEPWNAWRTCASAAFFAFHEFHAFALLLFFEGPLFFSVKVFLGLGFTRKLLNGENVPNKLLHKIRADALSVFLGGEASNEGMPWTARCGQFRWISQWIPWIWVAILWMPGRLAGSKVNFSDILMKTLQPGYQGFFSSS